MISFGWWFAGIDIALAVGFSLIVLARRKRQTSETLAWILLFLIVPVGGVLLYLLIGYRGLRRRRRLKALGAVLGKPVHGAAAGGPAPSLAQFPEALRKTIATASQLSNLPPTDGNQLTLYEDAHETYEALATAIQQARHHVHMEYYIFQPDETGARFRDLLIAQAKRGIECRLLVDHIGSFRLSDDFLQPLRDAGVQFAYFFPVRILRPWGMNLRNHRKIVVIDGKCGFIGSQNIGNEYINRRNRRLSWRDTHACIRGPGVADLQTIFCEDWQLARGGAPLAGEAYFPALHAEGPSITQVLPSGPDENDSALEMILMTLIAAADKRLTITTPYFIPSLPIILSLEAAVRRGVRVQVLLPRRSDHRIVDLAGRSWNRDLLNFGAEVYEYDRTFVHAKVVTVDDEMTLLGSANMDERSFRINFECSLLVYDSGFTRHWNRSFETMLSESRRLNIQALRDQHIGGRILNGLFRVLSPLL